MAKMSPEEFVRQVAQIAKMPAHRPDLIVEALRSLRADFDEFCWWSQGYLDSSRWAGHGMLDAIRQVVTERDKQIAAREPFVTNHHGSSFCFFCKGNITLSLLGRRVHTEDCLWQQAKQKVEEVVPHG
jgi:hypothetical protein